MVLREACPAWCFAGRGPLGMLCSSLAVDIFSTGHESGFVRWGNWTYYSGCQQGSPEPGATGLGVTPRGSPPGDRAEPVIQLRF